MLVHRSMNLQATDVKLRSSPTVPQIAPPCAHESSQSCPLRLLKNILGHLSLQDRLTSAALVNVAWSSAAARATLEVDECIRADKLPHLSSWMEHHGQHLTRINISECDASDDASTGLPLRLPCAQLHKLQSLVLEGFTDLQMPIRPCAAAPPSNKDNTSATEATAVRMPALYELQLVNCTMPTIHDLCNIGAALPTDLAYLVLNDLQWIDLGGGSVMFTEDNPQTTAARRASWELLQCNTSQPWRS